MTYVCNEFDLCTKGDPFEYYNLLSYEISLQRKRDNGYNKRACGSSDCFSTVENSDGMPDFFRLMVRLSLMD